MITRLQIKNFKSLQTVDVTLGGLNLFVGTNSSGKSNFLDALRVLQGIGNGFTLSEILNGKPRTATSEIWDGIRGGAEFATFQKQEDAPDENKRIEFDVSGRANDDDDSEFAYHVSFLARSGRLVSESLSSGGSTIFDSVSCGNAADAPTLAVTYFKGNRGRPPRAQFERSRPVLHQFADFRDARTKDRRIAGACISTLADLQRLDPSPNELRRYSSAQQVARMGEHGENFAALVSTILNNEGDKQAYVEWLQELSPADVDDVQVLRGALNEPLFAVLESGKTFPAPILSDGTLRFAAIAAAFFQSSMPGVLTLEEIEKGVHPNRLRLLVELLRSQTKRLGNQVIATTHSPDILGWLSEADLQSTFLSIRDQETGASSILTVGRMEPVRSMLRQNTSLAELFSEGWLESVA